LSLSETLYWHDYETSGAEPARDRPWQFAGVRTNRDLEIIGTPLVQFAQPTPEVLPHPAAVRITGITPQQALAKGVPEREFIAAIHAELARPKTCGVGYNSIAFDDEVTRFTLWRNFYDPYRRESAQGNSRWDLIDVARACYALRPEGVNWPTRDDGLPSFRLEDLTAANGIEHGAAHDALADVQATIEIARRIRAAQPALFETLYAQRLPRALSPLIDVERMKPLIHVSAFYGAANGNVAMVAPVAPHPLFKNAYIFIDLSRSIESLDWDGDTVRERMYAKKDELPEGVSRPNLMTIRLNRAPALLPADWLNPERAARLGLDGEAMRGTLADIRARRDAAADVFRSQVQGPFKERDRPAAPAAEEALYEGFIDNGDRDLCDAVRDASAEELKARLWPFRDERMKALLFRYRACNYPDSLSTQEQQQWLELCRDRWGQNGYGFNLAQFEIEMAEERARGGLNATEHDALDALQNYVLDLSGRP